MAEIENHAGNPGAVLIDGHGRADLGVVRALGERGVPIYLLTDDPNSPVAYSRYITRRFHFPSPRASQEERAGALMALGRCFRHRPVFFSTGDGSLTLFSRYRDRLERHFAHHVGDGQLIEGLYDKVRFVQLARKFDLPVPFSSAPSSLEELEEALPHFTFPVMVKPAEKKNWDLYPAVHELVGGNLKGVRVASPGELLKLYRDLTPYDNRVVIQNYIEGRDEEIWSLHTYIDRDGDVVGAFTGQKIRTYPIHRGIGCFQLSVIEPAVMQVGLGALKALGYTGHAIVQMKRVPESGRFEIFEINCRYSTWNYLHTRSGVNLPYAAYRDSLGEKQAPLPPQRENTRWIDVANDLRALIQYRRVGEWGVAAWLRTYLGRNCYALFAWHDPLPVLAPTLRDFVSIPVRSTRRLVRAFGQSGVTNE